MPAAKQEKTQQLPTAAACLLGSPGEQQGPEEPEGALPAQPAICYRYTRHLGGKERYIGNSKPLAWSFWCADRRKKSADFLISATSTQKI